MVGNALKVAHKLQQLRDLLALAVAERLHCAELEHVGAEGVLFAVGRVLPQTDVGGQLRRAAVE